jgi:hypothetical protein
MKKSKFVPYKKKESVLFTFAVCLVSVKMTKASALNVVFWGKQLKTPERRPWILKSP